MPALNELEEYTLIMLEDMRVRLISTSGFPYPDLCSSRIRPLHRATRVLGSAYHASSFAGAVLV